jgi:tetratricopeptide (TPR) repeat protein
MKLFIPSCLIALCCLLGASCNKYLDVLPKGKLIPTTTEDFRQLLDNNNDLNYSGGLAELATDNMFISDDTYLNMNSTYGRNAYIWAKDVFAPDDQIKEWNNAYLRTYVANVVLDGLSEGSGPEMERNILRGEALFIRATALYTITQVFCAPFDSATAASTLGAPIRLTQDVFLRSKRPTLQESYDQLIKDLTEAANLLPPKPEYKTRPGKTAAFAMLARVFLSVGNYGLALDNALKALAIDKKLLDYRTLDPNAFQVFPLMDMNSEMIMFDAGSFDVPYFFDATYNPELYDRYADNDLRKTLYFTATINNGMMTVERKASYADYGYFTGLANDELYLIAAECYARNNELANALKFLNDLLIFRFDNSYVSFQSNDQLVVLTKVLEERRKELAGRNLRLSDLRRLNKDPRFALTLTRTVGGATYTLAPNDNRYTYPVPQSVINQTGMEQNPR